MSNSVLAVFFLFINIILNSLASVLLKTSSKISTSSMHKLILLLLNPFFIGGLISFGLSFIAYNVVLKYLNVNIAYPIVVSGSIVLVSILSKIFLKEQTNFVQITGIIIILLGVSILTFGNIKA